MWKDESSALCEAGRELVRQGLLAGTSGNLSVRRGERVLATPRGARKGTLQAEDLCELRRQSGHWARHPNASSEIEMHLAIYDAHPRAGAVVHAHPRVATVLAALRPLPSFALTIEGGACLGPIGVVEYVRPGGRELAEVVAQATALPSQVVLLEHHGAVTWGETLSEALSLMEVLEHVAHQVQTALLLRQQERLSRREVSEVRAMLGFSETAPRDPVLFTSWTG